MESCLLCLDINKDLVDCIKVDSTQWQELNIKNLIEKHLWIMESFLPSSWLCQKCWQALFDFHKFYVRIEDAHTDFSKLMKRETKDHKEDLTRDENKTYDESNNLFESHLEPEILIDQLAVEDYKPAIIKEELDEDLSDDNIPLFQRNKRNRPSRDITIDMEATSFQDPLKNSKKVKSSKSKNKKTEPVLQSNTPIESALENSKDAILKMKQDPDILQITDKSQKSLNSSDSEDNYSHNDFDYKPKRNIKRPKKTIAKKKITKKSKKSAKKMSPRSNINSDCDDFNAEFEYKPEEDDVKRSKQTYQQKDQFLAENFKMCCVLCQVPMTNFNSLVKHFETEHKERGYAVCCNKKFHHRAHLLEHVHRHVDPNNFKCNQCGKMLSSLSSLQSHQLIHLSEEEKKFPCTECGKSYAEQKILTIHINRVHLRKYVKICDICGKRLRCGEAFQRHMLEHEGKPLPTVTCDVCGLLLATKHSLKKHKRMQHPVGGKIDYICNICFKVSPNIAALREHKRRTHSAESHICTMCGRGFKVPLALKEHMATHTGIALYTCQWCPKTFNASGGLHAHRKRQHPIEWEQAQIQKKLERYKTPSVMEISNSDFS